MLEFCITILLQLFKYFVSTKMADQPNPETLQLLKYLSNNSNPKVPRTESIPLQIATMMSMAEYEID